MRNVAGAVDVGGVRVLEGCSYSPLGLQVPNLGPPTQVPGVGNDTYL